MKNRHLMLFLTGVTLVFGLLAVQQFAEAFGNRSMRTHISDQRHRVIPLNKTYSFRSTNRWIAA